MDTERLGSGDITSGIYKIAKQEKWYRWHAIIFISSRGIMLVLYRWLAVRWPCTLRCNVAGPGAATAPASRVDEASTFITSRPADSTTSFIITLHSISTLMCSCTQRFPSRS